MQLAISEQLVWRAVRMLTDDNKHDARALAWASRTVQRERATAAHLISIGFTPREVSLGAEPTSHWRTQ
jgi:hypothetical protein